ncbi:hypothetical protein M9458_049077, partial [Cirrhinus mrigala]
TQVVTHPAPPLISPLERKSVIQEVEEVVARRITKKTMSAAVTREAVIRVAFTKVVVAAKFNRSSRMGGDPETLSMHSMRVASMPRQVVSSWAQDDSDGSLVSERDATYTRQASMHSMNNGYAANTYPRQSMYSTSRVNGFESGQQQVGSMTLPAMKRSLSGTLATGGGGGGMEQEVYVSRHSFKGPAHRTISRINNRQTTRSMPSGMYGSGGFSGSQGNLAMQQGRLSVHSVGRGKDVFDGMDMDSMGNLSG